MADRTEPKQMPIWRVVAVLCLAGTTVSLQQTMVIPLLPGFQELMHISTDNVSWLVTATLADLSSRHPGRGPAGRHVRQAADDARLHRLDDRRIAGRGAERRQLRRC